MKNSKMTEEDVKIVKLNYILFMLSFWPRYFRSYFQTMIDCKAGGEEVEISKDVMGHVVSCQYFSRSDIKEE